MVDSNQEKSIGVEEYAVDEKDQGKKNTIFLAVMFGITQYHIEGKYKSEGYNVDSRSTHNFIDAKLVTSMGLKVVPLQIFRYE